MNRFRFLKVRDVKSPTRSNSGDAGLDFYVPYDLVRDDILRANHKASDTDDYVDEYEYTDNEKEYSYGNGRISDYTLDIIHLGGHQRILIPSGIRPLLEPRESMLMAANKSGIAANLGLIFTAEIVDSPYTGEMHIGVYNTNLYSVPISAGQKLIQFIHVPIYLTEPEEISQQEFNLEVEGWGTRGSNGFGSSDNI